MRVFSVFFLSQVSHFISWIRDTVPELETCPPSTSSTWTVPPLNSNGSEPFKPIEETSYTPSVSFSSLSSSSSYSPSSMSSSMNYTFGNLNLTSSFSSSVSPSFTIPSHFTASPDPVDWITGTLAPIDTDIKLVGGPNDNEGSVLFHGKPIW